MNFLMVIQMVQVVLFTVIFSSIYNGRLIKTPNQPLYDINEDNVTQVGGFATASFFLYAMRNCPLDLIVNTLIAKILCSKWIEWDADMTIVTQDHNGKDCLQGCKAQSMQLPEQLGCVDHIFCDKTGTLTKNELRFRTLAFANQELHFFDDDPNLESKLQASRCAELNFLLKCIAICHDVIPIEMEGKAVLSGSS